MFVITPIFKGSMHYVGVGLVYKSHGLFTGNVKRLVRVKLMWPPARHTSFERGGVLDLSVTPCHPGSVDTLIPCPGMVDKEEADTIGVHSSQTITF